MSFDHLILLIGTNPLPNYVVARYFLENNPAMKTIIAAHTSETYAIAQRLEKVLRRIFGDDRFSFSYCGLSDPGDAQKIRYEIEHYIFASDRSKDKFHLNYTGGTKVMGIHAYLQAFLSVESGKISFSYLDARDFTLKIEGAEPSRDLRKQIKLGFGDLLDLHGCRTGKIEAEIDWAEPNKLIANWIVQNRVPDFLLWRNKAIISRFYDADHKPKKEQDLPLLSLDDFKLSMNDLGEFQAQGLAFLSSFPSAQGWQFNSNGHLVLPESTKRYDEWFDGIKYIDGKWLEYYTSDVIAYKSNGIFTVLSNQHIFKEGSPDDFEIDVLVINGYQLCGISVTTAHQRSYQKSKAFEILHRSSQIGGEEARSILVSTMTANQVNKLTQDLAIDAGDSSGQLLILGIDDLEPSKMWQAVYHHITGE